MTGTVSVPPVTAGGLNVFWRHIGPGIAAAGVTFTAGMYAGNLGWHQLPGFLPVAVTMGLSGWAYHRVWSASLAPVLRTPARWTAELTRVPFWFMAGGMGAVIGILIAKKYGMLEIRDIPVGPWFTSGARAYTGTQIAVTAISGALTGRKLR